MLQSKLRSHVVGCVLMGLMASGSSLAETTFYGRLGQSWPMFGDDADVVNVTMKKCSREQYAVGAAVQPFGRSPEIANVQFDRYETRLPAREVTPLKIAVRFGFDFDCSLPSSTLYAFDIEDPSTDRGLVHLGLLGEVSVPIDETPGDQYTLRLLILNPLDRFGTLAYTDFSNQADRNIRLNRYSYDGVPNPIGLPLLLNAAGSYAQAMDVSGPNLFALTFAGGGSPTPATMAVWSSVGSAGDDSDSSSIQGRFIDGQGSPIGDQFQVNDFTLNGQFNVRISGNENGDVVVVWDSFSSPGNDNQFSSIQARQYGMNGQPLGPQFQVNQTIAGFQSGPDVAVADDGTFAVVWADDDPQQGSLIYLRTFNADGTPNADDLIVSGAERAPRRLPQVLVSDDLFVIAWAEGGNILVRGTFQPLFENSFE